MRAGSHCGLWATSYLPCSKATAAKLRSWRVAILRSRAHYLGEVQASDESRLKPPQSEFKLSDEQRRRLVVQERN
jgi:hypothetical protein